MHNIYLYFSNKKFYSRRKLSYQIKYLTDTIHCGYGACVSVNILESM